MTELLRYDHVYIAYDGVAVVRDISFSLAPGEILGIVGESGCGKSTILKAAMGLLGGAGAGKAAGRMSGAGAMRKAAMIRGTGAVTGGDILYKGESILGLSQRDRRRLNGAELGMVFQDAGGSFCPVRTIGAQLYEIMEAHGPLTGHTSGRMTKGEFAHVAARLLAELGLEDAERVLRCYPFELSGGMMQRVGVAAAMLPEPGVLLADEPTAALDTAVQRQVIEQLLRMRDRRGTAMVLVSHNIGIIEAAADSILVMKGGRAVEYGQAQQVLRYPREQYTRRLLDAVPRLKR